MQDATTQSCKFTPKQSEILQILQDFNGADGRIRTGDLILTKDALYLLSYISAVRTFIERECYYTTPAVKKQYLFAIFTRQSMAGRPTSARRRREPRGGSLWRRRARKRAADRARQRREMVDHGAGNRPDRALPIINCGTNVHYSKTLVKYVFFGHL